MLTVFVQKLLWLGQLGSNQSTAALSAMALLCWPHSFISSIQIQSIFPSLNFCPEWAFNGICISKEYAFQKTPKMYTVSLNHLRWESSFLFLLLSLTLIAPSTSHSNFLFFILYYSYSNCMRQRRSVFLFSFNK